MKTANDFMKLLENDEAIAGQLKEKLAAAKAAGATDVFAVASAFAQELGYQASRDELERIAEERSEDISEEDLGNVAGGSSSCSGLACCDWLFSWF